MILRHVIIINPRENLCSSLNCDAWRAGKTVQMTQHAPGRRCSGVLFPANERVMTIYYKSQSKDLLSFQGEYSRLRSPCWYGDRILFFLYLPLFLVGYIEVSHDPSGCLPGGNHGHSQQPSFSVDEIAVDQVRGSFQIN